MISGWEINLTAKLGSYYILPKPSEQATVCDLAYSEFPVFFPLAPFPNLWVWGDRQS